MKKLGIIFLFLFTIPTTIIHASEEVYLGGNSIGIVANYEGVYVSGTTSINYNNKSLNNDNNIKTGDLIIEINTMKIHNLQDYYNCIHTFKETINVPIVLIRNNQQIHSNLLIVHKDGKNDTGLYLKDSVTGIGTLTYIDKDTNTFGCLGHPITNDNNSYLQKGTLYNAYITSIKKAEINQPGEKIGKLQYDESIGIITNNNDTGVYGTSIKHSNKELITTANMEDIKLDKAIFLTVLKENKIEEIEIKITSFNKNETTKSFEFEVLDQNFIHIYGGITHGMSGSPIIQDGKLVGAVTHVLVNDPTRGYGIFIENMLDAVG